MEVIGTPEFNDLEGCPNTFGNIVYLKEHAYFPQRKGNDEKTEKRESIWEFRQLHSKLAQLKTTTMGEAVNHQACREVFEDNFFEQSLSQKIVSGRKMMQGS